MKKNHLIVLSVAAIIATVYSCEKEEKVTKIVPLSTTTTSGSTTSTTSSTTSATTSSTTSSTTSPVYIGQFQFDGETINLSNVIQGLSSQSNCTINAYAPSGSTGAIYITLKGTAPTSDQDYTLTDNYILSAGQASITVYSPKHNEENYLSLSGTLHIKIVAGKIQASFTDAMMSYDGNPGAPKLATGSLTVK
jgi:hypothetical protein